MAARPPLLRHYEKLLALYGPQGWWPSRTRAETVIGAILTQNTAWTNVEKAVAALRKNRALDFAVLHRLPAERLAAWIRPAGYFNQKAACLQAFARLLHDEFGGSLGRLFRLDTPALRRRLLAVKGIGPETADCILLYAARRPVFVVDAYTRRFLADHGLEQAARADYDDVAALFTAQLPADTALFNEYHALLVRRGKEARKKAAGRCTGPALGA